ncbi:T9SS type A sorting domain-containing protein [candidate division KSB1 bacterium]|nr:T9SS type A sorting domain-containing protein [candidate division KSB1 bacterium]
MFRQRLAMILFLLSVCVYQIHAQTSTILVDFGSNPSAAPWINLSAQRTGIIQNLTDSLGIPTNMSLEVFDAFNGINTNGTQNPDPSLGIPNTASGDSFFGNTVTFSGSIEATGGIRLSNLDTEKEYTLTVFASRDASDNRETRYICTGAMQDTAYLNVASNTSSVVTFSDYPTTGGTLEIVASPGPNNNNSYGFFYLGALIIEYQSDPYPNPELQMVHPNGGEFWQVGKNVEIEWNSTTRSPATLDYSTDDGSNWTHIGTFPPFQKSYDWPIPDTPSEQCLVRVTSDTLIDQSDNSFEISSEIGSCSMVVLGSSTAEGTGASIPDSAWVYRFRNAVYLNNTRHEVINLAKGGYSTYQLLPDGSTSGASVGIAVDTERNITKALSLNPTGIIINLPSNDAASNYPVEDQLANFEVMVSEAEAQGVPVWICTTQPRNFTNSGQIQIQKDVRDSIFAIYGDYAIDFWNGLAEPNGYILDVFDSGDGTHLNDQGHRFLYQRVMEKVDMDSICVSMTSVHKLSSQPSEVQVSLYPNPFNLSTKLEFILPVAGEVEIVIYNIMGQEIKSLVNRDFTIGPHEVVWDGTDNNKRNVNSGTYIFRIKAGEYLKIKKGLIIK